MDERLAGGAQLQQTDLCVGTMALCGAQELHGDGLSARGHCAVAQDAAPRAPVSSHQIPAAKAGVMFPWI